MPDMRRAADALVVCSGGDDEASRLLDRSGLVWDEVEDRFFPCRLAAMEPEHVESLLRLAGFRFDAEGQISQEEGGARIRVVLLYNQSAGVAPSGPGDPIRGVMRALDELQPDDVSDLLVATGFVWDRKKRKLGRDDCDRDYSRPLPRREASDQ